ncbi:hypothetical protein [Burkholderia anthina]
MLGSEGTKVALRGEVPRGCGTNRAVERIVDADRSGSTSGIDPAPRKTHR